MPPTRTRNVYDPDSEKPFKLSRSRLALFLECPRCFYLDRRLGVDRVSGPPFTLNTATDTLLKKEFDIHRTKKTAHPLMKAYKIDAIPFAHPDLDDWRHNFRGVQHLHEKTNLLITGAVDDVWVNPKGKLIVVDYKSTSTTKEIDLNDGSPWKEGYKRQMEVYQWLLRQNGFSVLNTGYFVYVNAKTDRKVFDGKLEFDVKLIAHRGKDDWVENTIVKAWRCLRRKNIPKASEECEWCAYRSAARRLET